ncbi:3-hydroxybutyrate dehydrogenase [Teredinibacter purpureus]|jgi:3-hydroxybutyrate dehydrogenase|uniref:3-hydroxybutyrate dehydrogenase n=1 Tax=Teredinibacter purpureus TaxID=2731756 RepID=UPI0005F7D70E|nr:3-hydroxybutyrate dehydrogenase [Teredinibacter purpureus]
MSYSNQPLKRTALVTGAGSGIGAALSLSLAKQGFDVVVSDLDEISAQKVADEVLTQGFQARAFKLDVSKQDNIDGVEASVGPIDILINNAGLQFVAKLEAFPPEKWRQLNEVLLVGPAMLTRALLPSMKAKNFGRIINIGSIHALVASPFKSAYVAAKHGILGFSKVIALETSDFDITINTLCPSYVKTPLVEKQIKQQAQEYGMSEDEVVTTVMLEPMPKKAFIEMEELSGTVEYLVSSAAKNVTGQSIVLDGGWTAR